MAKRRADKPKPDFHRQTVLFQWALAKFGVRDLNEFKLKYQIGPDSRGGIVDDTGTHHFFESIKNSLSLNGPLSIDRLRMYEQNILEHTLGINTAREKHGEKQVQWMYFQYLALLFTEMFLDQYFDDPEGLRDEINAQIAAHNERSHEVDRVIPFPTEPTETVLAEASRQLAMLGFWCATGSGKTLLMMMHIRQFLHHHKQAYAARKWPALDQIIIVTPNDGLSAQHQKEFSRSGFEVLAADDSSNEGLFSEHAKKAIKIISITKFQEERGKTTLAIESFQGCNLVLVDEGHRGAGRGEEGKWMSRRDQLAREGFCIEYSATFKEAIGNDDDMRHRYARSILFDYAYRSFFRDGYGKDFTVLNLDRDDEQLQRRYLTAALLLFYQQLKVWKDGGELIKPFLIDKPLWVFVGHTVAGKVSSAEDKGAVSDVVEVLLFFKRFLAEPAHSRSLIQQLLESGFQDQQGRQLLDGRLPHLDVSGDKAALAASVHEGILQDVFNAAGGGALKVQMLKGKNTEGELAVRVGEAEPFCVVNVGDPTAVAEACEKHEIARAEDDLNRESLFRTINDDGSPVNLLVGSRKFTEGWNSWRVSSIGLMRMGKSEGTQIIQMFGRGVRLRGFRHGLRRSMVLTQLPPMPQSLRQVETLQVFGVKASYLERFRLWIQDEVPEALERQTWELPVVKTLPQRTLKTLRLREEIDGVRVEGGQAFRMLGPLVRLRPPHETSREDEWLRKRPVRLNWMPRIRGIASANREITSAIGEVSALPRQTLRRIPSFMFDFDGLLFGLESFKAARSLDRLHVDRAAIKAMLAQDHWYELYATAEDMRLDRYENRAQWQRMAQQLLNAYAERLYRFVRGRWESPYLVVVDMAENNPSIPEKYMIETTERAVTSEEIEQIAKFVSDLKVAIGEKRNSECRLFEGKLRTVVFADHLYQPILHVGKNAIIRISPVALNESEAKLVKDLAKWCSSNRGREIYLLRNQAVIGLGFFQAANFFPDFLLWLLQDDVQHLAFVDPKGLRHLDPSDPRIQFSKHDVPRMQKIVEREVPDLRLHAFIVSGTPYQNLHWSGGSHQRMTKAEVEALGVLFQVDDETEYIDKMFRSIEGGQMATLSAVD